MHAASPLALEPSLSAQAREDLDWLRKKLGVRCEGLTRQEDGIYCVTLVALVEERGLVGGVYGAMHVEKRRWYHGQTPGLALSEARADVQGALAKNRRV